MKSLQHKNQRVGVFIDVQNLYYSGKQLYQSKVNFGNILEEAVAGRKLVRAIAYSVKADIPDEHVFFTALENLGFEVRIKELQVFYGGAKKGDWDIGIAMDMIRMAPKLDCAILMSGDGDFTDLLKHVKSMGCRVEVVAFQKTSSSMLLAETDMFTDIASNKDKFLMPLKPDHKGGDDDNDVQRKKVIKKPTEKRVAKKNQSVKADGAVQEPPVPKGAESDRNSGAVLDKIKRFVRKK